MLRRQHCCPEQRSLHNMVRLDRARKISPASVPRFEQLCFQTDVNFLDLSDSPSQYSGLGLYSCHGRVRAAWKRENLRDNPTWGPTACCRMCRLAIPIWVPSTHQHPRTPRTSSGPRLALMSKDLLSLADDCAVTVATRRPAQ